MRIRDATVLDRLSFDGLFMGLLLYLQFAVAVTV
jgi:hypothetical protein